MANRVRPSSARGCRLGFQPPARRGDVPWVKWEPGYQILADPEQGVDGPVRRDLPDGQGAPPGELVSDQSADRVQRDLEL